MEYEELPWPVKIDILKSEIESLNAQLAFIRQENMLYASDARRIRLLVKPEEHEELFEALSRALAECRDKALEEAVLMCENEYACTMKILRRCAHER